MVRRSICAGLLLLSSACSRGTHESGADSDASGLVDEDAGDDYSGADNGEGDDALIVPPELRVMALPGGNGVLEVIAFTLRQGKHGVEVYAALRNEGTVPACSAAFSVELFDKSEGSLASGIGGLLTPRFYRLSDGSEAIAACVGPGDVTMAALTDFRSDITVDEVGYVVYRCPYFALEVEPLAEGLSFEQMRRSVRSSGTSFMGTLSNGLDVGLRNPSVSVFPVNRVGRPLGMAQGAGDLTIEPGGSWTFETSSVSEPGVDFVAFAAGALTN